MGPRERCGLGRARPKPSAHRGGSQIGWALLTAIQRNLRCCLPAIYLLLTLIHAHLRAIYPHFTRNSPARYPPFTRTLRAIHLHFPAIHLQFTAVYLHL